MFSEDFEVLAKKICEYCMRNYVIPYLREHGAVFSYRAHIDSKNTGSGTMTLHRPFDNSVTIPYNGNAASLDAGDDCVVFYAGDSSNARVVSDANLNL